MRIPIVILLLAFGTCRAQEQTLLANARIVDVVKGTVTPGSVLIQDGIIVRTGTPDEMNRIPVKYYVECTGKYIIPGLWDMHVHLEGAELVEDNQALLPVFLAYGITTVRDCASDLGEQVLAWRDEIADGKRTGPTIYTAGLKLEGKNSIWKGDLEIENEDELKAMLDKLDRFKVDFVKITEIPCPEISS